jgi:hypothetical protein
MKFFVPGTGMDIRTANSLLKKMGRPRALTTREQANQITQWCFRNNSALEDYHAAGMITQTEMKPTMIEASARIDYLLRTRRFFRWAPKRIFDFAFREAIANNCAGSLTEKEWSVLRSRSCTNLAGIQANRLANRRFYMLFLIANVFYSSASSWDTDTLFDGAKLIHTK